MLTAKVFRNGRSQAVRLPKECRFDADEVCVARLGEMLILFPRDKAWDVLADAVDGFTPDFMADRAQPRAAEDRDRL